MTSPPLPPLVPPRPAVAIERHRAVVTMPARAGHGLPGVKLTVGRLADVDADLALGPAVILGGWALAG